jgi:DNA-binding NtrC family response regulator
MASPLNQPRNQNIHILVSDHDELMRDILINEKYSVTFYDPLEPDSAMFQKSYDIVILDVFRPQLDGFQVLGQVRKFSPYVQCIIITGMPDQISLEKAMELGVFAFLTKPFSTAQIKYSIMGALRLQELLKRNREIKVVSSVQSKGLIGSSAYIAEVRRKISEIAPLELPVIIAGESGTGKEVVARCIHDFSLRAKGHFTTVNCAGLPQGLIESELFGHVQGAFTGAVKTKHGYFEVTDGGTLFLDEIGDLPLELQNRLLHVLDNGEYNMVGDTEPRHVDVRIVCATNCDLAAMTEKGAFRKDLYYRLRGTQISLLPLRKRKEDIPELVRHFLSGGEYAVVPDAMEALKSHDWPGNIRQLKMVILNIAGICTKKIITLENVASVLEICARGNDGAELLTPYKKFKRNVLLTAEKEYFKSLVEASSGNIAKAARMAGIDRKNFYDKLKKFGLTIKEDAIM